MKIVETKNLSYTYNKGAADEIFALSNINMHVEYREAVAIIGPSGAGKSTLIQHFNGLILPQNGQVLIDGTPINEYSDLKAIRKKIGLLFQNPEDQIFERYVGDEIAFALFNFGYSRDKARDRVKEVLKLMGYDFEFKNRLTKELSGGEKRLVSFLSVLAYEPELLVLDEPTVGLDSFYRRKILGLIKEWTKRGGAVVMVSHDMNEVYEVCDRVYLLKNGVIVDYGEAKRVLMNSVQLFDCGLTPPDVVMFLTKLKQKGIDVDLDITTNEDLVNFLVELILSSKRRG